MPYLNHKTNMNLELFLFNCANQERIPIPNLITQESAFHRTMIQNHKSQSFTLKADGLLNQLITHCGVCIAFNPLSGNKHPEITKVNGLWDTGASGTVIDKDTAAALGLKPISKTKVFHANGEAIVNVYAINLILPNNIAFQAIKVTEGNLNNFQLLIGMDIISKGDFALTNYNGKTAFSFRIPSLKTIDFVVDENANNSAHSSLTPKFTPKINGNDLCRCGSGKPFLNCHGNLS